MKNSYALLTGFVIVIAILIAGSCNQGGSSKEDEAEKGLEVKEDEAQKGLEVDNGNKVWIEISYGTLDEKEQFKVEDSNGNWAVGDDIESLVTVCHRDTVREVVSSVEWRLKNSDDENNNIKELLNIVPIGYDSVFINDPERKNANKWTLEIPYDAEGTQKYYIILLLKNDSLKIFDPHLEIPPP